MSRVLAQSSECQRWNAAYAGLPHRLSSCFVAPEVLSSGEEICHESEIIATPAAAGMTAHTATTAAPPAGSGVGTITTTTTTTTTTPATTTTTTTTTTATTFVPTPRGSLRSGRRPGRNLQGWGWGFGAWGSRFGLLVLRLGFQAFRLQALGVRV